MDIFYRKCGRMALVVLLLTLPVSVKGQVKLQADTLECHMVGFSVGGLAPLSGSSTGLPHGNMKDLYGGIYMDYTIGWAYKWANGWMATLDADMWIGSLNNGNNLMQREERLSNIYNSHGASMGWNGLNGEVAAYNRALSARPGVAYIVRFLPKNPNSGLLLKMSAGWMTQKTVFSQGYTQPLVPQLNGRYAQLYDHRRNGLMLTESIGFIYMSNYLTYVNLKVSFELSQCWSWSSRPYQIDNLMGLNGKDHGRYFDLLGGVNISWIFPFTGKTTYDYYYY